MTRDVSVRIVSNALAGELQAAMRRDLAEAVGETLLDVQADWAADVRVDEGDLRASIDAPDAIELAADGLSGSVGTGEPHAGPNEYGGPTIGARPSARQAAEKNRARFVERARRAVGGR